MGTSLFTAAWWQQRPWPPRSRKPRGCSPLLPLCVPYSTELPESRNPALLTSTLFSLPCQASVYDGMNEWMKPQNWVENNGEWWNKTTTVNDTYHDPPQNTLTFNAFNPLFSPPSGKGLESSLLSVSARYGKKCSGCCCWATFSGKVNSQKGESVSSSASFIGRGTEWFLAFP